MNTDLSIIGSDFFDIYAEHNGVHCVRSTLPEDQGTSREYWFTIKMLCEIFEVSDKTLRNNIQLLIDDGEFVDCKKLQSTIIVKDSLDRDHKVVLYDLEVLNKLGMCCFRGNQKAREIRNRFNDVLVKEETKQNTLPALSKEDQLFLNIIHTTTKEQTALALNEYKIYRDEREQEIAFERDEAIRTKAYISQKREATLMGKVGGTTKALNVEREKNTKLLKENIDLIKEKEELKIKLQESTNYLCVKAIPWLPKYFIIPKEKESESVYSLVGKRLTALSKKLNYEIKNIPDPRYPKGVGSYHTDVVEIFRKQLDNDATILAKYRI